MNSETKEQGLGTANLWGVVLIALGALYLVNEVLGFNLNLLIPSIILIGISLTFFTLYRHDRRHWWALIPAYVMMIVAIFPAMILVNLPPEMTIAFLAISVGFPFLVVYRRNEEHWWALIPAYVMFIIAIFPLMIMLNLPPEWVISFLALAVGFPFLVVYQKNQEYWWALIPAYVMFIIAAFPMMMWINLPPQWVIAFLSFAMALPFFVVYLRNKAHWWALVVAGIFGSGGVVLTVAGIMPYVPILLIGAGLYLLLRQRWGNNLADTPVEIEQPPAEYKGV